MLRKVEFAKVGTVFVLLVVYPAIYEIWKWHFELKRGADRRPLRSPPCRLPRCRDRTRPGVDLALPLRMRGRKAP